MGRPAKSVELLNKNLTKEEEMIRKEEEKKLRGQADRIRAPSYLSTRQKKIFKNIVKELQEADVLGNLDVYILSTCAIDIDRMQMMEEEINNNAELLSSRDYIGTKDKYTKDFFRCCNELCLSPQSRAKLGNLKLKKSQDDEDPVRRALMDDDDD